jgi:hypothetical protein
MVVVTMTSGANTILNDNRRSQFDGAEEGGEDKISEFFNSKLPWDMTLPISLTYGNKCEKHYR